MVVTFDVDDTLVMWDGLANNSLVADSHPYKHFIDPNDGSKKSLKPHLRHIELLKSLKNRGYTVIVWSAGGGKWANSVVTTLGLADYVDIIMSKPIKWVDDITDANKVLGTRIYLYDFAESGQ